MKQLQKSPGLTPSELAEYLDRNPSDISRTLTELSKQGLVVCLNPNRRKGRIYALTKLGTDTLKSLDQIRRRFRSAHQKGERSVGMHY
jgi:DNA-binding MarR family transcriptional regulator